MPARLALAAVSLLAIVYLSIGLRNVVLVERGERLAALPGATPAQIDEAERLLERGRLLDPDTRPLLAQGAMLAAHGEPRRGVALVERAVRREPDSAFAWSVLAGATQRTDPERSRQARARLRELSPPVPGG